MRLISRILALLIAAASLSPIDIETAYELRVRGVIAQINWEGSYSNLGGGWFEFQPVYGPRFRKFVGDARTQQGMVPKRIQEIDTRTIDTTGFSARFKSIGVIPLGGRLQGVIGLRGSSGRRYLAGVQRRSHHFPGIFILDVTQGIDPGALVRLYADSTVPISTGRFKAGNYPHLVSDYGGRSFLYETLGGADYPTSRITTRDGKSGDYQEPRVGDFNRDGYDEILIRNDLELTKPRIHISRYDTAQNIFMDVFTSPYERIYIDGSLAAADFDSDGTPEFGFSASGGYVFIWEYQSTGGGYINTLQDTTRLLNTGWNGEGNDVDGDGRRECFIGSSYFGGPYNLAVYESTGDNTYELPLWIYIRGIGGFEGGMQAGDVDGDGREELAVCFGGVLLILKAESDDSYSVFWMKTFPDEVGVTLFDIDGDGAKEVCIGTGIDGGSNVTEIFRYDRTVFTHPVPLASTNVQLTPLYPSPGNTVVHGKVKIPRGQPATLSLYSAAGVLLKREEYYREVDRDEIRVSLDCRNIPDGLYFATLVSNGHSVVRKIIVLHR